MSFQERDPKPESSRQDAMMLRCIRRANLDTFWSRETTTVHGQGRILKQMAAKAASVGMTDPSPDLDPYPVENFQGMGIAVCILMKSLDPGRNEKFVQYGSAKKMRSAFANLRQASLEGRKDAVVQRNTSKMFSTSCPTHGPWFERFMHGSQGCG